MNDRYFLFGAGYSALAFARLLGEAPASGAASEAAVSGTTRSAERFPVLEAAGVEPLLFDGATLSGAVRERLASATHLVVSTAPAGGRDPVLGAAADTIRREMPALRWIGYLSTVGVYGDHGGAWVDEESTCRPVSLRSRERLDAERAWQALGAERGVPVAVLRLSGIYGPGRNALANLAAGTARRLVKPGQVFNRIHVDDIAGALRHLAARQLGGVFNVTDDLPAPPQDVVLFAAGLMGVAPPPEIPFETAQLSPMARSFYEENKRVANRRLGATGFVLRHPDYRSALTAMWEAGTWRGGGRRDDVRPGGALGSG